MQPPDTIHNLIVWLVSGGLFGVGFAIVQWSVGEMNTTGKAVLLIVLIILAVLLVAGLV